MKTLKKVVVSLVIVLCFVAVSAGLLYFVVTRDSNDAVMSYNTTNEYITPPGEALVSAHRSGGGIFPENTLMALEDCVNSSTFKTDIFEFDLHLTKDGVLILLHDDTFDRTSDAVEHFGKTEIKPADYTYDELRELNMGENFKTEDGGMPYKGLRGADIPQNLRVIKVEDVFTYLESHKKYAYVIEIKDGNDRGERATDELYRIITEKGLLKQVFAASFKPNVNDYQEIKYPDMLRSAGIFEVVKIYIYSMLNLDAPKGTFKFDALQIPWDNYVINLGTTKFINYAHKNNIAVQYWTINDEARIKVLNDRGADAIITDYPDRAYSIIHSGSETTSAVS